METSLNQQSLQKYAPLLTELQRAFGHRLKTVVLFGSQARGEAAERSDHDLFVVIEGLPTDPVARAKLVRHPMLPILHMLPESLSLVARTPEEVAAQLTSLLLDVCVDGICLFGPNFFEPYRRKALIALRRSGLERKTIGRDSMWVFSKRPAGNWELSWEGFREGI